MKNKMQADFEDFKARYAGGLLNDAADDGDKLLHTVAWDAWQAATLAERKNLAATIEVHAEKLHEAMANGKTLGEKHNVITLGKIEVLTDLADAITRVCT